jgi:hypothetical protein
MKKKIVFLPLLFLLAATGLKAQMWNFATKLEGTLGLTDQVVIKAVDTDTQGCSYVTGYYTGQLNSSASLNSVQQDGFVAKFNGGGTLQWVHKFGGPGNDAGNAISVMTHTSDSSFYITGYVQYNGSAAVSFDGLGGPESLPSTTACAAATAPNNIYFRCGGLTSKQAFVAKYKQNGDVDWVKPIYSISCMDAEGLAISTSWRHTNGLGSTTRDVYVTGYFEGNSASFMSSSPCTFINVTGNALNKTAFVAKFNSSGNANWAKSLAVPGNINAMSVGKGIIYDFVSATNPNTTSGGVFITGNYQGAAAIGTTTLTNAGTDTRVYVANLTTNNGTTMWVQEIRAAGAGANAYSSDIACRQGQVPANDELFVYGDFTGTSITAGTLTPVPGGTGRDIYLAKFNKSSAAMGNQMGIIADGGTSDQYAGGIDISGDGGASSLTELFVSGAYDNQIAFTGGSNFGVHNANPDQFMARYTTWLTNTCAEHWDAGRILNAHTIDACDVAVSKQVGSGHAYYGGMFLNGDSPVFSGMMLNTSTAMSGFVSKWICCACPAPTISVSRIPANAPSATVSFTWPPCNYQSGVTLYYGVSPSPGTPWSTPWGVPSVVVPGLAPLSTYTWVAVTNCQESSNMGTARTSSIKENLQDPTLKFDVYPNPTEHMLYFEANEEGTVEIYSLLGALVKTKSISGSKAEVDVSGLPEGNYVCKFTNQNNAVITKKIQVMH